MKRKKIYQNYIQNNSNYIYINKEKIILKERDKYFIDNNQGLVIVVRENYDTGMFDLIIAYKNSDNNKIEKEIFSFELFGNVLDAFKVLCNLTLQNKLTINERIQAVERVKEEELKLFNYTSRRLI